MISHGDPEFLICTCHHRKLTPEEAVIFLPPCKKTYYAFARDCPEHGIEWLDEKSQVSEG